MLGYKILIYYVSRIEQHQNDLLEIPIKLITRFKIKKIREKIIELIHDI